jgi:enoyl-CoA hydratase
VVPAGNALSAAKALAVEIARFPQLCLRADRASTLSQWSLPLDEALQAEGYGGQTPLAAEAEAGARRFTEGEGRGGRSV